MKLRISVKTYIIGSIYYLIFFLTYFDNEVFCLYIYFITDNCLNISHINIYNYFKLKYTFSYSIVLFLRL